MILTFSSPPLELSVKRLGLADCQSQVASLQSSPRKQQTAQERGRCLSVVESDFLKNEYDKVPLKRLAVCALSHKAEGSVEGMAGSAHYVQQWQALTWLRWPRCLVTRAFRWSCGTRTRPRPTSSQQWRSGSDTWRDRCAETAFYARSSLIAYGCNSSRRRRRKAGKGQR